MHENDIKYIPWKESVYSMNKYLTSGKLTVLIVLLILIIDQIIKIMVKTNMALGDSIQITNWFYIRFIENNGMAYGMTFINKLVLSLFRIIAICAIIYYICKLIKRPHPKGYIVCLAMILAGAMGNIIDSMFYGLIFTDSTPYSIAQFVPFASGYSTFLHGKVVDMFYFPLIETTWPTWIPYYGGHPFVFFSPIFNFADSCISVGVVLLLIFYRKQLETIKKTVKDNNPKIDTDE